MHSPRRPRLTSAIADVRRAVRAVLPADGLVLVGLSGGADSLALAAATRFEATRSGVRAGVVIVDHGLQSNSASVAENAAEQARNLGLAPVIVERVHITAAARAAYGIEAAARDARRAACDRAVKATGARFVLLGHTLDDQAETVLLGLARGSGAASLSGMAPHSGGYVRPLLGIRRAATRQFCADSGLVAWNDPHNIDPAFARVRVRARVLPVLEAELGPGIAEALARTAEQLREDSEAFERQVVELVEEICVPVEAGIGVDVGALAANPPALRNRIIRYVVRSEFGVSLDRGHTRAVSALVTEWHGQKPLNMPGVRVSRQGNMLQFQAASL
jgi:tRNA(Ile)-lysidine synthase